MPWSPKQFVRSVLYRMGLDVRWRTSGFHSDAYDDQVILMRGRSVDVIIEGGANVGWTCLHYASLFPLATVHAFEPFEESYRQLAERCGPVDRIKPHRMALADAVERKTFHANQDHLTNSLLPVSAEFAAYVDPERTKTVESIEVPTTTIQEFCAAQKIDRVSILKLDIEGGEMMALRASQGMLEAGAIELIYTEVSFGERYVGQSDFIELCRYLQPFGYTLYGLYDLNYGKATGILGWGDAIFISSQLRRNLFRAAHLEDRLVQHSAS